MPQELAQLLESAKAVHGLATDSGGTILSGGVINHNWLVETPRGNFVVRVYPPTRRARQVAFEVSILEHLTSSGCRVPRVIRPEANSDIPRVGERCTVLLQHLPARPLGFSEGRLLPIDRLVTLLVPIDHALERLTPAFRPIRETRVFQGRLPPLLRQFGDDPARRAALVRLFERLQAWEDKVAIPTRVIHADIHAGNILIEDGAGLDTGDLWLIDFDDAHVSYRAIDWVLPSIEFSLDESGNVDEERYRAILTELSSPSTTVERSAFSTVRTMMFLKFAATYAESGHPPSTEPVPPAPVFQRSSRIIRRLDSLHMRPLDVVLRAA